MGKPAPRLTQAQLDRYLTALAADAQLYTDKVTTDAEAARRKYQEGIAWAGTVEVIPDEEA